MSNEDLPYMEKKKKFDYEEYWKKPEKKLSNVEKMIKKQKEPIYTTDERYGHEE
jgi:hypothetical protein